MLLIASIEWSNYASHISISLYFFFGFTFLIAFFMGYFFKWKGLFKYHDINLKVNYKENLIITMILGMYLIEGVYSRGFPLLATLGIGQLEYTDFGIPVLHVFLVTFHSFYTTYFFHKILGQFNIYGLIKLIFLIFPAVLILNRGMLMMFMITFIMLFSMKYLREISLKSVKFIILICISSVLILYFFGLLGNMRSNHQHEGIDKAFDSEYIMAIGDASDYFRESIIPKQFFWGYIYTASPIFNLNLNIENPTNHMKFDAFLVYSILPDFISNRIGDWYGIVSNPVELISPGLNVTTAFGEIYVNFGWLGMLIFILFIFTFFLTYLVVLKSLNSRYYITGLVTINLIVCLFLFSNMWTFSALSFQLIYPLIFTFFKDGRLK